MKIGDKIRRLRLKNNLTQEELANRCELSKGFISQVERDLTSPSIATFIDILDCLGTNLRDFFNEAEEEKIVFRKEDVFETDNKEHGHLIRWLVPNSQKNTMEPILVELEAGGSTVEDGPHEGEEFGFVLAGSVSVRLGGRKYRVKKGESFYFKPSIAHSIANAGNRKALILWVSTPPSF